MDEVQDNHIGEKCILSNFICIDNNSDSNEMGHTSQEENCVVNSAAKFWYAIHTRRHYENVVTETLGAKGLETYLPMLEDRRRWTHRTKILKVPLFANYVFARFDTDKRIDVISIKGVVQIVGTHCGPSPIPDTQIEAVRIMVESKLKKDPYPFLVEGMDVRVKRGPLKGQEGVLLRRGYVHRFAVCLPVLGQSISVEIDASALESIQT